ncbi:phosphomannomutase [Antarcticirhabdus aurantiaca]|uniref:Phosphomannomutase n=1 Tax=Antarcticirhabdus aurantiaca TaxID=2606717 RepID=A0ACD4NPM7_9HYPH|nr:phosphomannomutase [Jeongeuplla avenae]
MSQTSSLKFGTSGLRGLVSDLVGAPSRTYAGAFLKHLAASGRAPRAVLVGRDLRSSSPRIAADCARAARALGIEAIDCGALPTPALAGEAIKRGLPAIMVTGSHIPDDRNGLKFYAATGEITKADEAGILAAHAALEPGFGEDADETGTGTEGSPWSGEAGEAARAAYLARNIAFFADRALSGLRVGVYQHSSVARDLLVEVLEGLGASVEALGRADRFVPVDTEAHRPEDRALIAQWTRDGRFDAVVSSDGDADRPLMADASGAILRGDVLGLLTARFLGAAVVATPVTSASAIERVMGAAGARVSRTRVGSPFVLEAMEAALAQGASPVVGFEANGGVLLGSDVALDGRRLQALPTRDAFLPILAALALVAREEKPLARIVEELGAGFTAADRLQEVPATESAPFLTRLAQEEGFARRFFEGGPAITGHDTLDGVRVLFDDGSVVHYRASGNAPELRCYVEAPSQDAANTRLAWGLKAAQNALREG